MSKNNCPFPLHVTQLQNYCVRVCTNESRKNEAEYTGEGQQDIVVQNGEAFR